MVKRIALISLFLLAGSFSIRAQVPPTAAETDRFLSGSGILTAASSAQKIAAARAIADGSLSRAAVNCLASAEVLDAQVNQVFKPLLSKSVANAADLNAAIQFNESSVGRRIAAQIERAQAEKLAAIYRGESPPPMAELTFSADEIAVIQGWESSTHFAALQAFEQVLEAVRSTPEHHAWLSTSLARCKALSLTAPATAGGTPYDNAQPQARADALNPETRDYYLNKLRPAFSVVFQTMLNACASKLTAEFQTTFGLVLTVTPQGTAKQILWRTPNELTECLETGIRAAKYPPAPKDEFFLGMAGGVGA